VVERQWVAGQQWVAQRQQVDEQNRVAERNRVAELGLVGHYIEKGNSSILQGKILCDRATFVGAFQEQIGRKSNLKY